MKIKKLSCKFPLIPLFACIMMAINGLWPVYANETPKDIEYEAGFYYTIKKGDTLWDLSQRFDDSPWQWPDLWQKNDQIPNPHWIYPGERIRLFRKSDHHRYTDSKKAVPTTSAQVEASAVAEPAQEKLDVYYHFSDIDKVGFIRKPAVEPLGSIFKVKDNKKLISFNDIVYIRPPKSNQTAEFTPGSRLTVYRTLKPTEEINSEQTIGTQHYLLGYIEVIQNEPQYAIAKVIASFRHMKIDDLLMPYESRSIQIMVQDSIPGIDGKIINGEEHTQMLGAHMVAFIDKGKTDNIETGQIYNIYYQDTELVDNQMIKLDPVDIGSLIVLRAEKTTSTVMITQSSRKITTEHKIRTP